MVFTEDDVIAKVEGLSPKHLYKCIDEGWIKPKKNQGRVYFADIDIVRLQLILNLQLDLSINTESIPIILSLIDQVHGLRHKLRFLADAIGEQPEDIQQMILQTVESNRKQK